MSSPLPSPSPSPPQCIQGFYYSDLELVSYTILKMKKNGIWVTLYQILDQNVTIRQTTWSRELYHESSDCAEYPKESLLKSSYPKKYLPKFSNLVPRAFPLKNGRGGVTAFWVSPRFGHPHSHIPSVLGIPGGGGPKRWSLRKSRDCQSRIYGWIV